MLASVSTTTSSHVVELPWKNDRHVRKPQLPLHCRTSTHLVRRPCPARHPVRVSAVAELAQRVAEGQNSIVPSPFVQHFRADHEPLLPLYVSLGPEVVTPGNTLNFPEALKSGLRAVRCLGAQGVAVEVWWGVVEAKGPQQYDWSVYHRLLRLIKDAGLKAKVSMCFHSGKKICLPPWVQDVGREDPDIYYADKTGFKSDQCLSLGVDEVPVLNGRTGVQVYTDFMSSFKHEFSHYLGTTVVEITMGLGPDGELRYPSTPEGRWNFPGVGEFQCYDRGMLASLAACAAQAGISSWGLGGPHDAGCGNLLPHQTGFFHHQGSWNTAYGAFFMQWYSAMLITHADRMLAACSSVFRGTGVRISGRLPGIHWWFNQAAHAAELTAGFYNTPTRDGYVPVMMAFQRNGAGVQLQCAEMRNSEQPKNALCDPETLLLQMRTAASALQVPVCLENSHVRFDEAATSQLEAQLFSAASHAGIDLPLPTSFVFNRMGDPMFEPGSWQAFKAFMRRVKERADLLDLSASSSTRSLGKVTGGLTTLANAMELGAMPAAAAQKPTAAAAGTPVFA